MAQRKTKKTTKKVLKKKTTKKKAKKKVTRKKATKKKATKKAAKKAAKKKVTRKKATKKKATKKVTKKAAKKKVTRKKATKKKVTKKAATKKVARKKATGSMKSPSRRSLNKKPKVPSLDEITQNEGTAAPATNPFKIKDVRDTMTTSTEMELPPSEIVTDEDSDAAEFQSIGEQMDDSLEVDEDFDTDYDELGIDIDTDKEDTGEEDEEGGYF